MIKNSLLIIVESAKIRCSQYTKSERQNLFLNHIDLHSIFPFLNISGSLKPNSVSYLPYRLPVLFGHFPICGVSIRYTQY